MAFEPVYDSAVIDTYAKLGTGQAVVEARLLPKPETRIAKVLSTSCSVGIGSAETFTGEARYLGRVNFKVLFETADGNVEVLDYNADFSDKLEAKPATAATKTHFTATVLDMDITAAEEDVVKLAAVIEVTLYGCEREDVKYLSRGSENLYTHEDRVKCCTLVAQSDEMFVVSDSVTDLGGYEILAAEAEVFTYKREADDDSVTLEGEASVNFMLREKNGGSLSDKRIRIPVSQQCRADGVRRGDTVTGEMCVKNIAISTSEGGEDSVSEIELTLKSDLLIFRDGEITPCVDAFSLENELLPTVRSVEISIPKGDVCVDDVVEGSVTVDEKLPLADTVLGTFGARVNISNVTAHDGKAVAEGMLGCNVVYFNAEHGSSNTVFAQVPFSLDLNCPFISEGDSVSAVAGVKDVNVKIRRGNELSVRADVCVTLMPRYNCVSAVISEIKLGEAKQPREAALSVHIAKKGETAWEAAKALELTPEDVIAQNPDVVMPCAGGERLVAYRRLYRQSK